MRKQIIWMLVIAICVGGISGVLFMRFLVPYLSTLPHLSSLQKLESNNPVVINHYNQVEYNDGVNLLDLSKQASSYTVGIYQPGSNKFLSNGIITSSDGMIITSKANLNSLQNFTVMLNDGSTYPGTLRALDSRSELAVITISAKNLTVAQFAPASDLSASQRLVYLGRSNQEFVNDFALAQVTEPVANQASLERALYSESFENSILTDANLTPDYVGGPVIDFDGNVVGMINSNLGVLISEDLQSAVNSYLANGKIVRPGIGIKYLDLSKELATLKNLPQAGVLVVSVDPGSPAATSGIQPNDFITAIDNQTLSPNNFETILDAHSIGDLPVSLIRNGNSMQVTVKLEPK